MRDFNIKKNKKRNTPPDSSLLQRTPFFKPSAPSEKPRGAGGSRMKSRREMKENTITPMKPIDAKLIETNISSPNTLQNISVDEAMKTGSDMTKSVQPNMDKQEIKEEKNYLKQSEKGTWEKHKAKDEKKSKIQQAKQEFKSKYPFGASKSIVNGETSQMRNAMPTGIRMPVGQPSRPSSAPSTKIMSDLEKMVKRRGY